ncbi:hypothetical protein BD560DRAFT_429129 [Blakeslea trispora]|nr:hypothetical protein BD560DRAFT_429129 [Blakeslea trispora]
MLKNIAKRLTNISLDSDHASDSSSITSGSIFMFPNLDDDFNQETPRRMTRDNEANASTHQDVQANAFVESSVSESIEASVRESSESFVLAPVFRNSITILVAYPIEHLLQVETWVRTPRYRPPPFMELANLYLDQISMICTNVVIRAPSHYFPVPFSLVTVDDLSQFLQHDFLMVNNNEPIREFSPTALDNASLDEQQIEEEEDPLDTPIISRTSIVLSERNLVSFTELRRSRRIAAMNE